MKQDKKKNTNLLENKEKSITYSIRSITINRFNLIEPGLDIIDKFDILNLKVGFNLDFNYNIENNGFLVTIRIIYHYKFKEKDIPLAELIMTTDFQISDITIVLEVDGEHFRLLDDLLINFVSIAYSSARGLFYAKTQGSFLNRFILPLIDPKEFIAQNLKNIGQSN